jgi:hypothetical protein
MVRGISWSEPRKFRTMQQENPILETRAIEQQNKISKLLWPLRKIKHHSVTSYCSANPKETAFVTFLTLYILALVYPIDKILNLLDA